MMGDQEGKHEIVVLVDGKEVERDWFVRLGVIEGYVKELKGAWEAVEREMEAVRKRLEAFYEIF
jgi:hypothetical protein